MNATNLHCHLSRDAMFSVSTCNGTTTYINNPLNTEELEHLSFNAPNILLSTGQHPLYPKESITTGQVISLLEHSKLFAVGEVGFDKRNPDFEWQKATFMQFADIAQQYRRPLIIHCVGYYNELYQLLKQNFPKVTVILHRFLGSIEIVQSFSNLNAIFSLHKSIIHIRNSECILNEIIDKQRFGFETDADDEIDVMDTMQAIATFTGNDVNLLLDRQVNISQLTTLNYG